MNSLTRIALICLCLDVVRAQGAASGPSPAAATASNEEVNKLALWPDVDIRGLLAGEPNATGNAPNPIDLLFVLQAGSVTLVPANDGGLIGGQLFFREVLAQIVVFADRPYRTMDMLSLEDFFAFELVQDFFAGPNPPNAIITGELPQDIRLQRHNESDSMPYRRLLGTVLGAAEWDSQQPSELRFDIPAGMDIFRENGRVDIVDDELFQDLRKGYANASYDGFPTLHRVTVFIDPFQTAPEETQLNIGRRLLQRGRVGRRTKEARREQGEVRGQDRSRRRRRALPHQRSRAHVPAQDGFSLPAHPRGRGRDCQAHRGEIGRRAAVSRHVPVSDPLSTREGRASEQRLAAAPGWSPPPLLRAHRSRKNDAA